MVNLSVVVNNIRRMCIFGGHCGGPAVPGPWNRESFVFGRERGGSEKRMPPHGVAGRA